MLHLYIFVYVQNEAERYALFEAQGEKGSSICPTL